MRTILTIIKETIPAILTKTIQIGKESVLRMFTPQASTFESSKIL